MAVVLGLAFGLAGCEDFPKDSQRTLERIRGGETLRVGWVQALPWVRDPGTGEPTGIEPDLIRAWAQTLPARIEWVSASEAQLIKALQENAIDAAVGGLTKDMPWGGKIGLTQPYHESKLVVGVDPGTPRPPTWHGVEIRYDRHRPHIAGLIRSLGARPIPAQPGQLGPIGAAYAEELPALGLAATDEELAQEKRVVATAPAENAFTLELDRFLHRRRPWVKERLAASTHS